MGGVSWEEARRYRCWDLSSRARAAGSSGRAPRRRVRLVPAVRSGLRSSPPVVRTDTLRMDAAASGHRRAEGMTVRAAELEAQAAQLSRQAAALRGVADRVRIGSEGERQVGRLLDVLDGAGWHVLHDRRKHPRSPANLDHVVIGPAGVLVIDTKNWSGGPVRLDDRGMRLGSWRKDDALRGARADAASVAELARAVVPAVHCVGVLAFVQDAGLQQRAFHQEVVLVQAEELLPWLTNLPRLLTCQQVDLLWQHLARSLPPRAGTGRGRAATGRWVHSPGAATTARPARTGSSARGRRTRAGRRQRRALVAMCLFLGLAVTTPTILPVLVDQVLAPLSERLAADLVEDMTGTGPAPPR